MRNSNACWPRCVAPLSKNIQPQPTYNNKNRTNKKNCKREEKRMAKINRWYEAKHSHTHTHNDELNDEKKLECQNSFLCLTRRKKNVETKREKYVPVRAKSRVVCCTTRWLRLRQRFYLLLHKNQNSCLLRCAPRRCVAIAAFFSPAVVLLCTHFGRLM